MRESGQELNKKNQKSNSPKAKALNKNIHVTVDEETKELAQKVFQKLGMDMSTGIRIFLKQVVRDENIPFIISADPFYSESNLKFLRESINEVKEGKSRIMSLEELEGIGTNDEDWT